MSKVLALRIFLFLLPFGIAALYIISLFYIIPLLSIPSFMFATIFGAMLAYLFGPFGTEIVIPATILLVQENGGGLIGAVLTIISIILVDVFCALFLLWNFDLAEKAPLLGRFIGRTKEVCSRTIQEKRWGEKATLIALATYVALPFQMSGGVVGSILGRVMGMNKYKVFAAVCLGSVLGGVPVGISSYLFGEAVVNALSINVMKAMGILIIVGFLILILHLYLKSERRRKGEAVR